MEHNPIQTMLDEHEIICQAEEIIENLDKTWETDANKYKTTVSNINENHMRFSDNVVYQDANSRYKEKKVAFLFPQNDFQDKKLHTGIIRLYE